MYLSELQNKDIISVNTGANLGRIVDAEVNSEGKVISLVAENKKIFRKTSKPQIIWRMASTTFYKDI